MKISQRLKLLRSAITGRFVTAEFAQINPQTTVAESVKTPDASLPPLGEGPRRSMLIEIEVTADFEKRLDNQWMVEREIHADRWKWRWAE